MDFLNNTNYINYFNYSLNNLYFYILLSFIIIPSLFTNIIYYIYIILKDMYIKFLDDIFDDSIEELIYAFKKKNKKLI